MELIHLRRQVREILKAAAFTLATVAGSRAGSVGVDPSGRYFQDASGKPVFLIGYYGWAAVPNGYFIDHPARYSAMMDQGKRYGINYIRVSLGVNRFTDSTKPRGWDGRPTPVPFAYLNGKADLHQWDPVFWEGLKAQCVFARKRGILVHVSIFDGVDIRGGGEAYRYANSFWNPSNQIRAFYPDPDKNHNGSIEEAGEFYQRSAFDNSTGIGYYQGRLIDKAIRETAGFDNVFFEIGNELLSASSDWNTAVTNYVHSKTSTAVTQCGGGRALNASGWVQHEANTPAEVRANVASMIGRGCPAWEDPDGPALSDLNVSPDDLRRAAWYSFVGGAAGWGGFSADFWDGGHGFNQTKAAYNGRLLQFVRDSGVKFWTMAPRHNLVSNSGINSCLATPGSEYVAYIPHDGSATLDLSAVSGRIGYRTYDSRAGTWTSPRFVDGGPKRVINKPVGADDWVIHASTSLQAEMPGKRNRPTRPAPKPR